MTATGQGAATLNHRERVRPGALVPPDPGQDAKGTDRPFKKRCGVRPVADDQARRTRGEPMGREGLHRQSLVGRSGREAGVIDVVRKPDDQMQARGDALDPAAR